MVSLAGALLLASGLTTPANGAELSLRLNTEVVENMIYLSDVFDGVPTHEDPALARAPAPGMVESFTSYELTAAAQAAGHTWVNLERARRVMVTRASHAITATEIEALIEGALSAEGYGERFEVDLSNRNYVLHLPYNSAGGVTIAQLDLNTQTSHFEVTLTGEGMATDQILRGRAIAILEIPVIVNQLRINQEITQADIGFIDRAANRISQSIVLDAAELVGMAPRRNVRLGLPVRRSDIGRPILAARGERIRVRYQVPGMALTVMGEVLEDGSLGDVIRIRNSSTNLVFEAELTGAGFAMAIPLSLPQDIALATN